MALYNNTIEKYYNPYNFSPISKRLVYKPSWRNMISQDIPFYDGISGIIDVTFKARTPIIVKESKDDPLNVNHNGRYFIPGTSIKGMVRNVFEILTLSKMGSVVKDNRYSMRDLAPTNRDYTIKGRLEDIKAGFLVTINGRYCLIKSPQFERISYDEIGYEFNIDGQKVKAASGISEKYDLLNNPQPFINDGNNCIWLTVFTGKMQNKHKEFCFQIPERFKIYPLSEATIKNFRFVYEKETKSKSWAYWKMKMKNFESEPTYDEIANNLCYAPVFYTVEDKKISSLGLAFLHRELYTHSVHDFLKDDHKTDDLDLTQCVFGSSDHDLKGRVQFSAAFVNMNGKNTNSQPDKIILGSPKPTFYPFYLRQDKSKRFASTFSDGNAKINGWKRYLAHQKFAPTTFAKWNEKIGIKITPLPEGVTFSTKIRFHNLKPVELGALLSSVTFHNNKDKCFHLIGMGKPLGYGKLEITDIKLAIPDSNKLPQHFMALFEKEISTEESKNVFERWKNDVTPLFKIASAKFDQCIKYPGQGKYDPFDDFKAIKTQNLSIADFSPSLDEFELNSLHNQKP
jgi:CRISPR-associated protein (TIGR03986 family)